MAQRIVVWTETAIHQRREILKYWTKRNGTTLYAQKLIQLISKQIKTLLTNPFLYKKAEYPDTYVSAMGHFSIFYKVTKDQIIITAFWDNRQDPKKLLELLKK